MVVVVDGIGGAVVDVGPGAVVVVVGAGSVVVVVVVVGAVVVVVVEVVVEDVVVVGGMVTARVVEVGLGAGVEAVVSGATVVSAGVIEVPDGDASAGLGISSGPERHAPRSSGTTITHAVQCFPIRPERRSDRERTRRASLQGAPGSLGWMELATVRVKWAPGRWTTLWQAGDPGSRHTLILAHGAGAGAAHPLVAGLQEQLVSAGACCITFNYPFTEEGRRPPDRADRLLACHRAVAEWVRSEICEKPVLAGRSMGGRMGTYLAADGDPVRALVLYAYPLHPPGRPDRLRSEHLSRISVPMLFFRGSRDAFATPEMFDREVRPLRSATVFDLEGLDHSFRGRGRRADDVNRRMAEMTVSWLETLPPNGFGNSARSGA